MTYGCMWVSMVSARAAAAIDNPFAVKMGARTVLVEPYEYRVQRSCRRRKRESSRHTDRPDTHTAGSLSFYPFGGQ
jgi:hypothetical protein